MTVSRDALLATAALFLVACGFWYARDPDLSTWSTSRQNADEQVNPVSVNQIDWSADGRVLLSLSRGTVGPDGPLVLHDTAGGRLALDLDSTKFPNFAALSPDGLYALVGTGYGQLLWLSAESTPAKCLLDLEGQSHAGITAVALSKDASLAAAAVGGGGILFCNPQTGERSPVTLISPGCVTDLRFSPDGSRLVAATVNGWVGVWDIVRPEADWQVLAHDGAAIAAEFLPDGQRIVTAGLDDTVRIWNLTERREEWREEFGRFGIMALAVTADGKTAAWAGFSRRIIVWDLDRGSKRLEIATPAFAVLQLKFSPDGTSLAAAGAGRMIRMCDFRSGTELPGIDVVGSP